MIISSSNADDDVFLPMILLGPSQTGDGFESRREIRRARNVGQTTTTTTMKTKSTTM